MFDNPLHDQHHTHTVSSNDESGSILEQIDFVRLYTIVKKNIFSLFFILLLIFSLAYLYIRYTKPVFQSESILKLEVKSDAGVLGFDMMESGFKSKQVSNLSGEIEFIKSKIIFNDLIDACALDVSYQEYGNFLVDELYKNSPYYIEYDRKQSRLIYDRKIDITFSSNEKYILNFKDGNTEYSKEHLVGKEVNLLGFVFSVHLKSNFKELGINNRKFFFTINSRSSLTEYLHKNLEVNILNLDANTIRIAFKDYNIYKAMDIVNAIDTIYLKKTVEQKQKVQEQTLTFINEQLEQTVALLSKSESDIEQFVRSAGTINPEAEFSAMKAKIEELEKERKTLQYFSRSLDDLQSFVENEESRDHHYIPIFDGIDNASLNDNITQLNILFKEIERLKSTTKTTTLAYRNKFSEVETYKANILSYIFENKRNLTERTAELTQKMRRLEREFGDLPTKETELTRLRRYYTLWEKFYLLLMEKKVQYGISKAGTVPEFVILSPANAPYQPISPDAKNIYIIAFAIACFACLGLISLRYVSENKIFNSKDIEKNSQVPLLGSVPKYTKEILPVSRLVVDKNPKSVLSEALRSIRTNIDFMTNEKKKLISITSTISGEGKTFVAINLGGVLAQSNYRVVVIDLDMRKPKIHLGFGADNTMGMSNYLAGNAKVTDIVKKSAINTLDYITSGPTPPNPSELILREEFDTLLSELFKIYDIVLIDTPPVGLVTDGLLVMKKAHLPIYVIRSGYSQRSVLQNINQINNSNRFKNLSIILNSVDQIHQTGYGYGYGYGYYEEDVARDKSWLKRLFKKS